MVEEVIGFAKAMSAEIEPTSGGVPGTPKTPLDEFLKLVETETGYRFFVVSITSLPWVAMRRER